MTHRHIDASARASARSAGHTPIASGTHRAAGVPGARSALALLGGERRHSFGRPPLAAVVLLLIGWGLGEFSESVAQASDLDLVRDVAAQRSPLVTSIAHAFSWAGSGVVIAPIGLVLCAVLYRRGRHAGALALAVSALGAVAIANLEKVAVARPRPPVHHLEAVMSASFPSGHATQASALYLAALIVLLADRPPRLLAVAAVVVTAVLILGVAASRVYLGVHYPTDVAAGVLLGGAWSLLAWQAMARRRAPQRRST